MRFGYKLHQIAISFEIFCKKNKPRWGIVNPMLFVVSSPWRHKKINADNGLNSIFLTRFIELNRSVHIAVVGKAKRSLAIFRRCGYEIGDLWQCLE